MKSTNKIAIEGLVKMHIHLSSHFVSNEYEGWGGVDYWRKRSEQEIPSKFFIIPEDDEYKDLFIISIEKGLVVDSLSERSGFISERNLPFTNLVNLAAVIPLPSENNTDLLVRSLSLFHRFGDWLMGISFLKECWGRDINKVLSMARRNMTVSQYVGNANFFPLKNAVDSQRFVESFLRDLYGVEANKILMQYCKCADASDVEILGKHYPLEKVHCGYDKGIYRALGLNSYVEKDITDRLKGGE